MSEIEKGRTIEEEKGSRGEGERGRFLISLTTHVFLRRRSGGRGVLLYPRDKREEQESF